MSDETGPDLEALALAARRAIDYRAHVAQSPRASVASYAELRSSFSAPTPEHGEAGPRIIEDLVALAGPGIRPSAGPRFFGWVIGGSHPTGVAADWLTAAWGQNAGNLVAAPAAAAVEAVAADWLLDLLALPRASSVGFVTGATVANFVCLAAARGEVLRRVGWDVEGDGLFGAPPVTVVVGADAHATVFSALRYLGFGASRVSRVAVDAEGRMLAADFARAVEEVPGPLIAIAQAGQINTGVSDPFPEIAALTHARQGWLHVDGAFGLWARACPSRARLVEGVELADSWATDGHKWLQTPYDCGYAIVRDEAAHRRAMAISASYLPPAGEVERDPSAYVPELSRRARGFATWAMIRRLGRSGIAQGVERCCAVAAGMASRLAAEPGVEVIGPVELNQFMVRFGVDEVAAADRLTLAVIAGVQAGGVAFMGPAQWRGAWMMRVSVSSMATTAHDGDLSVDAVLTAWRAVASRRSFAS